MYEGYRWGPMKAMFIGQKRGMHGSGIPEAAAGRAETAADQLDWLDQTMTAKGSPNFICGDRFSLADLQLYCTLAYATTPRPLGTPQHSSAGILDTAGFWVKAWYMRCDARPSAAATDPARGFKAPVPAKL